MPVIRLFGSPVVVREGLLADAEQFYIVRRTIALDKKAAPADRLRAIEQLEKRGLGRPTERVETVQEHRETDAFLREMTPEQRIELRRSMLKNGGLRVIDEETATG